MNRAARSPGSLVSITLKSHSWRRRTTGAIPNAIGILFVQKILKGGMDRMSLCALVHDEFFCASIKSY
ncbi:hypothetical protein Tco_0526049 [Tanacetum coccineum]